MATCDNTRVVMQDFETCEENQKDELQIQNYNNNIQNNQNAIIPQIPIPQLEEDSMTICIAAICENGHTCVISADRVLTSTAASMEWEHKESKIESLSKSCVVMFSGDIPYAAEVIAKTRPTIPQGKDVSIISIAEKLRDTFIATHQNRAESVFLVPRGFTLKEFKEKGAQQIPQPTYIEIQNQLFNYGVNNLVEFLVVGVDNTGGHIFRVHYNGVAGGSWLEWGNKIGYSQIGSGNLHASIYLSIEGQHKGASLAETVFNVYSAKKVAELAPGVGSTTDLAVITDAGIKFYDNPVFEVLSGICNAVKKNKPDLTPLQSLLTEKITK